ncbi:MAG: type I 3-dehydroquinate dehydratase [Akkermansia sp.]|nr:type I 3-dehydroquinate dehydratase [Akkermansia sp.]
MNARARLSFTRPMVVGSVSTAEAWCAACAAESLPCDVVELRADGLPADTDWAVLAAMHCCRPVLVTVRHESEGGLRPMSPAERLRIALALLPLASALDWEIAQLPAAQELVAEAHAAGVPVIASAHDFEKTPTLESLLEKEQAARALGADVAKFAFRLHCAEDMMTGVQLLRRASGTTTAMGMGPLGAVSRLLYAQHGACLVYGYLGNTPTAPGQWSAALCRQSLDALGNEG